MRIVLLAHDFPPIPSPQSLRWAYLASAMGRLGHSVTVLCPDHPGYGPAGGMPDVSGHIQVRRTYPGPYAGGVLAWLRQREARMADKAAVARMDKSLSSAPDAARAPQLNWKGRLVERLRALYASMLFPDVRAEWNPWARRALTPLLAAIRPDVVIASHEPASTLSLGLEAARQGYPLVADLGDPVLASYTPRRWRRRAARLERIVCQTASLVVVTAPGAASLLHERHGLPEGKVAVVTQGHPDHGNAGGKMRSRGEPDGVMELLYTGSFYGFRSIGNLVSAVLDTPGVRLNVATSSAPQELVEAARDHPSSVRILGFLTHEEALAAQVDADVLVNIANAESIQVPGKLYEYLGARRPILHVTSTPECDPALTVLAEIGAGIVVPNDPESLRAALVQLVASSSLTAAAGIQGVDRYEWVSLARRYIEEIETALSWRKY